MGFFIAIGRWFLPSPLPNTPHQLSGTLRDETIRILILIVALHCGVLASLVEFGQQLVRFGAHAAFLSGLDQRVELRRREVFKAAEIGHDAMADLAFLIAEAFDELQIAATARPGDLRVHATTVLPHQTIHQGVISRWHATTVTRPFQSAALRKSLILYSSG